MFASFSQKNTRNLQKFKKITAILDGARGIPDLLSAEVVATAMLSV